MACVMSAMIFASCGSKEYGDEKKAWDEFESAIDKAKDCKELEQAAEDFDKKYDEIIKKDYKNDTCSKEENEKLKQKSKDIEKKFEDKAKELKCD